MIRKPNGEERLNDDSYRRCEFGLHTHPKPFATHRVYVSQNALLKPFAYIMCEECTEKRLGKIREEFSCVEIDHVGWIRR